MAQAQLPDSTDPQPAEDTFEALFARLEDVTAQLEAGEVPLDRAVALYEEGMTLAQRCQRLLSEAEQRIEQLREAYDGAGGQ